MANDEINAVPETLHILSFPPLALSHNTQSVKITVALFFLVR